MELGEKLRQARMEAGLSQRAVCADAITRNMLSRIENGGARPSLETLQYLAARRGKPVSFILEEDAVCSSNQRVMESARQWFDRGDYEEVQQALSQYRAPDEVYDRERQLMEILTELNLAERAISEGRMPYARELLEAVGTQGAGAAYYSEELEHRRRLLLRRAGAQTTLPSLDEELLLRGEDALSAGDALRAEHLLEAAEDHTSARWCLLRGKVYMARKDFSGAVFCLCRAEEAFPTQTAQALEICYRELGDYKNAYLYACRQK